MVRNTGNVDRIIRVLLGVGLIAWAGLFDGPGWAWLGLIPLLLGAIGVCPAYLVLGINTCPVKK